MVEPMIDRPEGMRLVFADEFDGPELDRSVWLPHYLPAWSSRATTAATYEIRDSVMNLSIPPDQGLWCAGDHEPPLRVSGIQSGMWSGPLGGTRGQQPFRDGAVGGPAGASVDRYFFTVRQSRPTSSAISRQVAPAARKGW